MPGSDVALRTMHRINERHNIHKRSRCIIPSYKMSLHLPLCKTVSNINCPDRCMFTQINDMHIMTPREALYNDVHVSTQGRKKIIRILLKSQRNYHVMRNNNIINSIWQKMPIGSYDVQILMIEKSNERDILWFHMDRQLLEVRSNYIVIG